MRRVSRVSNGKNDLLEIGRAIVFLSPNKNLAPKAVPFPVTGLRLSLSSLYIRCVADKHTLWLTKRSEIVGAAGLFHIAVWLVLSTENAGASRASFDTL